VAALRARCGVTPRLEAVLERFTSPARDVVVLAEDEARLLAHDYLGTEHLLLGLLRDEERTAARLLAGLEVTLDEVRARVGEVADPAHRPSSGPIPFTPRAKRALALALDEALSIGLNYIDTRHILFGLVRENQGAAARILRGFDVDVETVKAEIIRMRGPVDRSPKKYVVTCMECKSQIEFEVVISHRPSLSFPVRGRLHRTCPNCATRCSVSYGISA
jgi:ATP-dependent Clp protease ATP-binding subunit ClpA